MDGPPSAAKRNTIFLLRLIQLLWFDPSSELQGNQLACAARIRLTSHVTLRDPSASAASWNTSARADSCPGHQSRSGGQFFTNLSYVDGEPTRLWDSLLPPISAGSATAHRRSPREGKHAGESGLRATDERREQILDRGYCAAIAG